MDLRNGGDPRASVPTRSRSATARRAAWHRAALRACCSASQGNRHAQAVVLGQVQPCVRADAPTASEWRAVRPATSDVGRSLVRRVPAIRPGRVPHAGSPASGFRCARPRRGCGGARVAGARSPAAPSEASHRGWPAQRTPGPGPTRRWSGASRLPRVRPRRRPGARRSISGRRRRIRAGVAPVGGTGCIAPLLSRNREYRYQSNCRLSRHAFINFVNLRERSPGAPPGVGSRDRSGMRGWGDGILRRRRPMRGYPLRQRRHAPSDAAVQVPEDHVGALQLHRPAPGHRACWQPPGRKGR
jgi:hypothetical protein